MTKENSHIHMDIQIYTVPKHAHKYTPMHRTQQRDAQMHTIAQRPEHTQQDTQGRV